MDFQKRSTNFVLKITNKISRAVFKRQTYTHTRDNRFFFCVAATKHRTIDAACYQSTDTKQTTTASTRSQTQLCATIGRVDTLVVPRLFHQSIGLEQMDQKPKPSTNVSVPQTTAPAVTSQVRTSQIAPAIVAPHTSSYVLTSSNLRPVTNYTLVAGSQVPVTQQYVVQSANRTTSVPQYVSTSNMRHILSASSQPSNVTYMLPSGAHIVKMNNVLTTTVASDQRSGQQQFILTSSSPKTNPNIITPLGSQTLKTTIATATDSSGKLLI